MTFFFLDLHSGGLMRLELKVRGGFKEMLLCAIGTDVILKFLILGRFCFLSCRFELC